MAQYDRLEKVEPFWNDDTREWSEALPSPGTATIEKVVEHTQWPAGVRKMAGRQVGGIYTRRWFNVDVSTITVNPPTSVRGDLHSTMTRANARIPTDKKTVTHTLPWTQGDQSDGQDNDELMRAKTVRVLPTPPQKQTIRQWFKGYRFVFNKCVELSHTHQREQTKMPGLTELRRLYSNKSSDLVRANEWLDESVPLAIRCGAVEEFVAAYRKEVKRVRDFNGKRNKRTTPAIFFSFSFKTGKGKQSIPLLKESWDQKRSDSTYRDVLRSDVLKATEVIPTPTNTYRLTKGKTGRYDLRIPYMQAPSKENQVLEGRHSTVAIDPGVRSPFVVYDADGLVVDVGAGDMATKVFPHKYAADRLQARLTKDAEGRRNKTKRWRRRKAILRKNDHVRGLVDELHHHVIQWLVDTYKVILIPKFGVARMVQGPLHHTTKQHMLTWRHALFRRRLKEKAALVPGCTVIECIEPYTSKTCGNCGHLHKNLGGRKVFKCPNPTCGFVADRDAQAARNILMRWLTLMGLSPSKRKRVASLFDRDPPAKRQRLERR